MKLVGLVRCCGAITFLLWFGAFAFGQDSHIDLNAWGYKPRENHELVVQQYSQLISVGPTGRVVVGFVTRDRTGLVTRALPPLSFHIVQFSKDGVFLDQYVIPTSSWNENSILFGVNGELLVRTGEKIRLLSSEMKVLAERGLKPNNRPIKGEDRFQILRRTDRSGFLIYYNNGTEASIELLDSANLTSLRACPFDPHQRVTSVMNELMSWSSPSPASDPLLRKISVGQVCGGIQYQYSWHHEILEPFLVSESGLVLAGSSPQVKFLSGAATKLAWQDSFTKRDHPIAHVEASVDGEALAIAVATFAGGNRILDISSHIKSERLIVYKSKDGTRVKEVAVHPDAPSAFGFSLSPDGATLAFVADESVEIVALK